MLLGMQIMNAYGSCHKIGELKPGQICFLANTMEIKHAFYPVEVGLLYHFLNSSSRVRSSLRPRFSNMIGILRPRCSCSCISKNARSTPNFVPTEYGLSGVLKCEYLRLSIREDMIVYWDSIMI